MLHNEWLVLAVIALLVLGVLAGTGFFSREARLRRRRRKSHSRVISKTQRQSVRFSVRSPNEKK